MLSALEDAISPEVKINFSTDENGVLVIKESAADSKIKKLIINAVPEESFAFTLDYQPKKNAKSFKQLSCYLNPSSDSGINKSCDLVVITFFKGLWRVLLLELKSNKPKMIDTEKQLLNSELYLVYLMSILNIHYGIDTNVTIYQKTVITTGNNVRKESVYKPNDSKIKKSEFKIVDVNVVRGESSVNFGKLFYT